MFRKAWVGNLAVTFAGLIIGVIVAEVALAFLKPAPIRWYYPQPLHLPDQELAWVMKPNQHSYTHDKPVITNRLGLRSGEIQPDKEPGAVRVLCLGDSQTFGNGVAQDETFAARTESLLRSRMAGHQIEVINAGVAGYDTVQEVRLLERIASTVKPDVITIGFYLNDIVEVGQSKEKYLVDAESGEFQRSGLIKQFTPYRLIYLLKRSRVVTYVYWEYLIRRMTSESNILRAILQGRTPSQVEPSWSIIEDALIRAQRVAAMYHAKLIVFPIPAAYEFVADYPREQYRSRLLAVAAKLGIDHFDPTPQMKEAGGGFDKYFIQWDGHINPRTHNLIAELLADKITGKSNPQA